MIRSVEMLGTVKAKTEKQAMARFKEGAIRMIQGSLAAVVFDFEDSEVEDQDPGGVFHLRAVFTHPEG